MVVPRIRGRRNIIYVHKYDNKYTRSPFNGQQMKIKWIGSALGAQNSGRRHIIIMMLSAAEVDYGELDGIIFHEGRCRKLKNIHKII